VKGYVTDENIVTEILYELDEFSKKRTMSPFEGRIYLKKMTL
jgi:hypothetical protein